ncbi:MAG TPA: hypothetical protein VK718_08045 [Ferruginibacter sp.]|jgi:hypothetical protein|nr:hypothetical protein [Ferruginibacter sp.]
MKYYLLIILCSISVVTFAQTSYTDFIQRDNKIQWAAQYDQILEITPKVRKFGIREILIQQLQKDSCIENYRIENDKIILSKFCLGNKLTSTDSFASDINPYLKYTNNYNLGNTTPFIMNEEKCACTSDLKGNKFDVYKLTQIPYYKNARLYIKNILVTPLCLKRMIDSIEPQQFIWSTAYSSCFNDSDISLTTAKKMRCIDLGNSEQVYNFKYDVMNDSSNMKVFTLKNPWFSFHLFDDMLSGKVTVVDDHYNIIPAKKVINYGNPVIEVPIYDDTTGNQIAVKKVQAEVNIENFYEYGINQHFYFDPVKNILYSEVNYVNVYENVITSQGIFLGRGVHFRVYFVKPALYKKPKIDQFLN